MTIRFGRYVRLGALVLLAGAASACATLPRNALPTELRGTAQVAGMPDDVRALGLEPNLGFQHDFAKAMVDGGPEAGCDEEAGQPVLCVLVLSGGGGFGAYGAGVLNGWSQSGERPNFKFVTGISTGALIAPFAFLGSEWDDQLATAFRSIESDSEVFKARGVVGLLTKDSVASSDPLFEKISGIVTPEMLAAIAIEHRAGRRLYVGTTNLDTQQLAIWNIGAIADSGSPDALNLVRRVLLASASIPIATPPVMVDVTANGEVFDEMHADGGVQAQFFVPVVVINLPAAVAEANAAGFDFKPTPRIYVIRNSKFVPDAKSIERNLGQIAVRTIESMTQAMGRGDLYQLYAISKARGASSITPRYRLISNGDQTSNSMAPKCAACTISVSKTVWTKKPGSELRRDFLQRIPKRWPILNRAPCRKICNLNPVSRE